MGKLTTYLKRDRHTLLYRIVGFSLILSFLLRLKFLLFQYLKMPAMDLYNKYSVTEFLINYQGGFVRRGLIGEGLFQLRRHFDFDLLAVVMTLSIIFYLAVICFFFWKFRKKGYNWWVLMSPLLLNMPYFMIRKEYLMYGLFILTLYCLASKPSEIAGKIGACLILCIALLIHEPILFWGVPIYILFLCSSSSHRKVNYVLACIPLIFAGVAMLAKGSPATVDAINTSWNSILPGEPMVDNWNNSIGALGWDIKWALRFHWDINKGEYSVGRFFTPFIAFAAYYMFSNFMFVFNGKGLMTKAERREKKLAISLLYAGSLITLIPLFTLLSCDLIRIYQYAGIATFATFLILPIERILRMYPEWMKKYIIRFNAWLERMLPPGKGWMIFLLFFLVGEPRNFMDYWHQTDAGVLFDAILSLRRLIGGA
ncbi:MAG: hypothetical protein K2M31_01000 [Muribaculaceae bacterium]|nr:hypothetical protein [Muribaculaceae bacterium]